MTWYLLYGGMFLAVLVLIGWYLRVQRERRDHDRVMKLPPSLRG